MSALRAHWDYYAAIKGKLLIGAPDQSLLGTCDLRGYEIDTGSISTGHDQRHRLLGTEAPVHRLLRSSATDKGGKEFKNNGIYRISRSIDNLYASHSEG